MPTQISDSGQKLLELIRARYPVIFVRTYEEDRVREALEQLVEGNQDLQFFHWTCTRGLMNADNIVVAEKLVQAGSILQHILNYEGQAIFMLRDFHPFMDAPLIRRMLRDASDTLVNSDRHRYLVMTGPEVDLKTDIEKDVVLIDFHLPTKDELADEVEATKDQLEEEEGFRPEAGSDDIANRAAGMTLKELGQALALSLHRSGDRDFDVDTMLEEKKRVVAAIPGLEYVTVPEDMAEVGGQENLNSWLALRWVALVDPRAWEFGLRKPRGILLLGPPGTGKSLRCKDISRQFKLPLYRLNMGRIFGRYVGQSENAMIRALEAIRVTAPCVLWIDEIEKGVAGSQSSGQTDSGVTARVFGSLLTWMQEKQEPVFIAATANNISALPPELLRKGRFDEIFFIELPSKVERMRILAIHLTKRNRNPENFDLARIADVMEDFSGAEIEECVVAGLYAAYPTGQDLQDEHIIQAAEETVPLVKTMEEQIRALRDWAKTRARPASGSVKRARRREPLRQAVKKRPLGKGRTDAP